MMGDWPIPDDRDEHRIAELSEGNARIVERNVELSDKLIDTTNERDVARADAVAVFDAYSTADDAVLDRVRAYAAAAAAAGQPVSVEPERETSAAVAWDMGYRARGAGPDCPPVNPYRAAGQPVSVELERDAWQQRDIGASLHAGRLSADRDQLRAEVERKTAAIADLTGRLQRCNEALARIASDAHQAKDGGR